MKLYDIGRTSPKKVNQILETRFGTLLDFDRLTIKKADDLLGVINESIGRYKSSTQIHTSQHSPQYTELLVLKEGIESWLRQQYLTEGEMEAAQITLAARDFVDRIQNMIKEASEMLNEDLPPMGDTIKNQMGANQGAAFVGAATEVLNALLETLKTSREAMDAATRQLAGLEVPSMELMPQAAGPMPMSPAAMPPAAAPMGPPAAEEEESSEPVGRARR